MGGKGYNGDERMWDENMTAGWLLKATTIDGSVGSGIDEI